MNGITALRLGEHLVLAGSPPAPLSILAPIDGAIWSDLAGGLDVPAVAGRLADRFGLSGARAREQVAGALDAWRNAGLLTPPPPPTRPVGDFLGRIAARAPTLGRSRRRIYALCGRPIEIRFTPPELESLLHARFAHSETPDARPEACLAVSRHGDRYCLREPGRPTIVATSELAIAGNLVRRIVELSQPGRTWSAVLHAAAVGTPDGRAVILPGGNGRGKSILTAALLAAGYGYLSDDCVPIDTIGHVAPVPFGLCIKRPGWPVAARFLPRILAAPAVSAADGRLCRFVPPRSSVREPLPAACIAFPRYRPGATLAVRRLEPVEALWLLVRHRAWITRQPDHLAGLLAMLERLPAVEIDYGDVLEAVAAITDLTAG